MVHEKVEREWTVRALELDTDWELAARLRDMALVGETPGRAIALQEAAKRLLLRSQALGITWRDCK